MSVRFGPFILESGHPAADRGRRRDSPHRQGVRAAADARARRARTCCRRRYCSSGSGPTPLSPKPISRTWSPRFATRSSDQARAPVFIRTVHGLGYAFCGDAAIAAGRRRTRRGARVVLARVGPATLSAVRRAARDRTRSRCRRQARRIDRLPASRPAGGDGGWNDARGFRQQERHVSAATSASRRRSSWPMAMRSASGRCW